MYPEPEQEQSFLSVKMDVPLPKMTIFPDNNYVMFTGVMAHIGQYLFMPFIGSTTLRCGH